MGNRDRGRNETKKKPKKNEKASQVGSVFKEVRPPMTVDVVKRKRKERPDEE